MATPTRATPTTPRLVVKRRSPAEFKVCPLCGTLNVKENHSCCCCSWSGSFDRDPAKVQVRMWEMVDRSPELQILLLKELRTPWWKGPAAWIRKAMTRFWVKRLDIRA